MIPKIILHNSISLDGSLTGFMPNMKLHYQIAGNYKPDAHLIGSNTIKTGIELYENEVLCEEPSDFTKPRRSQHFPLWVIIDTKASLHGLLHTCRRFEFCRDVIILISEKTVKTYINYLKQRNYDYYIVGKKHVNIKKALELLSNKYQIKTILTDTGRILGNLLLKKGFVSKISLLIHPIIIGNKSYNIFSDIDKNLRLKLLKKEILEKEYIWLVYKVHKIK